MSAIVWRIVFTFAWTVAASAAGAEGPARTGESQPAPASPTAQELERIKALLSQLDDDSFDRRQAASSALEEFGPKAERPLREALAANPPPEARVRLQKLLAGVEFLLAGIAGDWEETRLGIGYKDCHRISFTAGALNIAPADYSEHQHYKYSKASIIKGVLTFHQITNPNFEFDVRLEIVDKDTLKGEATRGDGFVMKVEFKRIKERPKK